MSKGLKIVLLILAIVVVVGAFAFSWGKSSWEKIAFSQPKLQGLDLHGLTLQDFTNIAFTGQTKTVTATLGMVISNQNNFAIPFSRMKVTILYNDTLIAETSQALSNNKTVPANGTLALSDNINIILNNAGGNLVVAKLSGKNPVVDYVINVSVFGIPLPSIKNSFVW